MATISNFKVDADGRVTFKNPGNATNPLLTFTWRKGALVNGSEMFIGPTATSYVMAPGFKPGDTAMMQRVVIGAKLLTVDNAFTATVPAGLTPSTSLVPHTGLYPSGASTTVAKVNPIAAVVKSEPVAFWAGLHLVLNSAQVLALNVPAWLHIAILVVSGIASALAARQQVTPTTQV